MATTISAQLLAPARNNKPKDLRPVSMERPLFFSLSPDHPVKPGTLDVVNRHELFAARWWPGDGRAIPTERQERQS